MIRETLLDQVPLPPDNLHPMPTDGTAEQCALRYEDELREFFGETPPRFDCTILGMGPDGHTASLFPGHAHPHGPWVLPVHDSPKPPPDRLSLSLEIINQACSILFLVTGADKAPAIARLREARTPILPAGTVKSYEGGLVWLVDEAAWGGKL
jgi:6-phosphogluconolactonase